MIIKHFQRLLASLALFFLFVSPSCAELFKITVDDRPLIVEIAQSPTDQKRGLQHRSSLPADHGMLFVFLKPRSICMWMRNVHFDLDVGFFDRQMKLIQIETMTRRTDDRHCSNSQVAYALEVNRHWFKKHGIKPGAQLSLH